MTRKRKKVVKMRGSKTHGYGAKKKHRGKGSRGGRGFAGSKKHRKTYILKYKPNHLGKKGFSAGFKRKREKVINVYELEALSDKEGKKEIDLTKMGYEKLLGRGEINVPLVVKVNDYSEKAKEKIERAGGKIIAS